MGLTYGTLNRNSLPLYLKFLYGGTEVAWRQPYRINNFSNSGESVDGKYRISDLDVSFVDPNGSYFATQFGRGTNGFGSSFQVVAYLGGTMEFQDQGANYIWKRLGTAGAYTSTIHTGKIYGISYSDRVLRLRSKTILALTTELKWQFPLTKFCFSFNPSDGDGYTIGSFLFTDYNAINDLYLGSTAFYHYEDGRTKFKANAYVLGSYYDDGGGNGLNSPYPAMSGRGTVPVNVNYFWAGTDAGGTNFYDTNDYTKFEGTYFTSKTGTINSDESAREYGYLSLAEADAAKTSGTYVINKTRFKSTGTFSGQYIHFLSDMTIEGNPKQIFEYLMTGAMVSPYFTSSDLDSTSLNQSGTLCAYSNFKKRVDFDDGKVLDSIKDVVQCTQALFSVNASNKFEFITYGPRNLRQTIPSVGTADLLHSEFNNDEGDAYNRFIIKYRYDFENNKFGSQIESRLPNWVRSEDRLKTIECKWIENPNEAEILAQRLVGRYIRTVPHISFETNLSQIGIEVGTLLTITDINSQLSGKVVQVVGFNKDWEKRSISFDALDAESLYQRKGYAFWGTTGTLPGDAVSTSSISGWGTLGTVNNINTSLYGSQFSWW